LKIKQEKKKLIANEERKRKKEHDWNETQRGDICKRAK